MQHDCVSRCSQNSVVEPQTSCLPFGSTSCDALPSRSRQHCWIDSQAVRHVHRWSRTDDSTQGDRSLRGVRRNLVSGSPAIPPIVFPIGIAGNLLGSWRLFGFSQNHKDWGIYRDHHTIFQSKFCDSPTHLPSGQGSVEESGGRISFCPSSSLTWCCFAGASAAGVWGGLGAGATGVLWKTVSSLWVLVTLVANAFQSGSLRGVLTIGQ